MGATSALSVGSGRRRRPSRDGAPVLAALLLMALAALATRPLGAAEQLRLGTIDFPATGAAAAQPHFLRGVAALHSFWYDEALESFRQALAIDPGFAMAWWGVAMTYHRPYLPGADDAAGRRALGRITGTEKLTAREADYIAALRAYYSDQPLAQRTLAYAAAMEKLHRAYPEDAEAAAFCALALLGYAWANDEGTARQERAAALARDVYRRNPNHPGAAHYLIHSCDEPALAARALDAARHYATIAPDAPHALHMPSHIFLHLGRWPEVAASNAVAWRASTSWVQRKQLGPAQRDYHNFHWWIYACLQQGRHAQARELIDEFLQMRDAISAESRHFLQHALAAYVCETRGWSEAERLLAGESTATPEKPGGSRAVEFCGAVGDRAPDAPGTTVNVATYTLALAAAARGAGDADRQLHALRRAATVNNRMADFWHVRTLTVAATSLARRGDLERALANAQEAAALEEKSRPHPGPPSSIKPAHELHGELLLAAGRPAEALAQFNRALERHPNRALALLGRARAEAAGGAPEAARETYGRLLEIWREADEALPELREARAFVAPRRGTSGD